jgi:hypothetical protein
MKKIRIIAICLIIALSLVTCQKNKGKDKNISVKDNNSNNNITSDKLPENNKPVYVDKIGVTRFDPLIAKEGDIINGWKVKNIEIKKFKRESLIKLYYGDEKENQRDFSAKVEFEGKIEIKLNYLFESNEISGSYITINTYELDDNLIFPRLNYYILIKDRAEIIDLRIQNWEEVYKKLSGSESFNVGVKGEATFIIDKYIIDHADGRYYPYGQIHVVEVKDVSINTFKKE